MFYRAAGLRRLLHRFYQSPSEAQSTRHSAGYGGGGPGRPWWLATRGPRLWARWGPNLLLPPMWLRETVAHQFHDDDQRGDPGLAEKVHGVGQPSQVCLIQADASWWTRYWKSKHSKCHITYNRTHSNFGFCVFFRQICSRNFLCVSVPFFSDW